MPYLVRTNELVLALANGPRLRSRLASHFTETSACMRADGPIACSALGAALGLWMAADPFGRCLVRATSRVCADAIVGSHPVQALVVSAPQRG